MYKRFKNSSGSALASTIVVMAALTLLATSTTVSQGTQTQIAANTALQLPAFLNSQTGIELALAKLNRGESPNIDELEFAGGTITVTSDSVASTITSVGTYGNAVETQTIGFENEDGHTTIDADIDDIGFAKNCVKVRLTDAYIDLGTRNLRGVEVYRFCNLEVHAESMSVSWNLTPCQEEIEAYEATFNADDEPLVTFCHVPDDENLQEPYTLTISQHLWDTVHSTNHPEDYMGECLTPKSACNTDNGPGRLREVHFSNADGGAPIDDVIYDDVGVNSGTTLDFFETLTETDYQFGTSDPAQDALVFDYDMPFEFFASVAINFEDGSQALGVGLVYYKNPPANPPPPGGNPPPPNCNPPPGGNPPPGCNPPPPGGNPPPSDTEPPTVPQGLKVNFTLDNQVGLSWNASTDNDKVNDYELYRNGAFVARTTNLNTIDAGVMPATTYQYQVLATDPSGNKSALSPPVSATTNPPPGGNPPPPPPGGNPPPPPPEGNPPPPGP